VRLFREVEVEISNSDARRNSFFEEFSDHRRAVSCTDERMLSRQNGKPTLVQSCRYPLDQAIQMCQY
jgi:hypothetical protein